MRHRGVLFAALALIFVGLTGIAVMLLVPRPTRPGDRGMDRMFIERMVPHHDDAIEMAEMAVVRTRRPEIRRLAKDIRRSQTAENAQMRAWYRAWYGRDVPEVSGRMGMMDDMTDMEALEEAPDFDREFLEQMIPHHRMAVMMTTMAGNAGGRRELRELMDAMRRQQSREIDAMEEWYRRWYEG